MRNTNIKFKIARIQRGFTQAELAQKLGRSQAWVCQLECGLIQPDDLEVALVCRLLRVRPDEIFSNEFPEKLMSVS
jgi:transcriptional regulator with XRE-family HTH domain